MNILALDLATVTGWAGWDGSASSAGTVTFRGSIGRAFSTYHRWLGRKISRFTDGEARPVVVFEKPWVGRNTHQDTARKLMGFAVVTEMVAYEFACRCLEVDTNTVMRHFTGAGGGRRADKKARVIAACLARGIDVSDDNEADALAILDYAAHCCKVKTDISLGPLFEKGA